VRLLAPHAAVAVSRAKREAPKSSSFSTIRPTEHGHKVGPSCSVHLDYLLQASAHHKPAAHQQTTISTQRTQQTPAAHHIHTTQCNDPRHRCPSIQASPTLRSTSYKTTHPGCSGACALLAHTAQTPSLRCQSLQRQRTPGYHSGKAAATCH
jgi:hypothetical protein